MGNGTTKGLIAATALACAAGAAQAADWSDTALGVRYGTRFAEPYDNNPDGSRVDITKTIYSLTHVSGFKYGTNFFNVDMLISDKNDPGGGVPGNAGAQETYVVYRNLLDFGKISGSDMKVGSFVRGFGLDWGFDYNSKNDGYASKKRMFVIGPTVMWELPGFANSSILLFSESNAPNGLSSRYHYKNHAAFETDWGIPVGSLFSFNGYLLYIGSKGKNEFGGDTDPETHIDATFMLDAGAAGGWAKKTFMVGLEYEYWKNKFGNPTETPGAGEGATAKTPMIRFEYHF